MLEAAFWGLVTAGSLLVGAAIAVVAKPKQRWIGLTMAFGAGALIAAVAYELVLEAFQTTRLTALGFTCGTLVVLRRGLAIDRRGGDGRKSMAGDAQLAGSANAIVLGTVLDGIPESFVLGASLFEDGVVPVAVVVGVFVSNVPEALSGTTGLAPGGLGARAASSRCGAWSCGSSSRPRWAGWSSTRCPAPSAFALAFAGGALLVMLADTLMPEAFELGGREAGLVTALGFALGFALS